MASDGFSRAPAVGRGGWPETLQQSQESALAGRCYLGPRPLRGGVVEARLTCPPQRRGPELAAGEGQASRPAVSCVPGAGRGVAAGEKDGGGTRKAVLIGAPKAGGELGFQGAAALLLQAAGREGSRRQQLRGCPDGRPPVKDVRTRTGGGHNHGSGLGRGRRGAVSWDRGGGSVGPRTRPAAPFGSPRQAARGRAPGGAPAPEERGRRRHRRRRRRRARAGAAVVRRRARVRRWGRAAAARAAGAGPGPRAPRGREEGGGAAFPSPGGRWLRRRRRLGRRRSAGAGRGPARYAGRPAVSRCARRHGAGSGLGRAGAALRRLAAHRRGLAAPVLAVRGPAGAAAARGGGGGRGPGAARRAARPPVPTRAVAAGLGASPQQPGAPARGTAGPGRAGAGAVRWGGAAAASGRAAPAALCCRAPGKRPWPGAVGGGEVLADGSRRRFSSSFAPAWWDGRA